MDNAPASLADIFMALNNIDQEKVAAPESEDAPETNTDFTAEAEKIAAAEAAEGETEETHGEGEGMDMMKVAAEYDAAGRIMARGFFDEFNKLAAGAGQAAGDNHAYVSPSTAKTPALGTRGTEPMMDTNHVGKAPMASNGGKENFKGVLKSKAGPVGFATVQSLTGGK